MIDHIFCLDCFKLIPIDEDHSSALTWLGSSSIRRVGTCPVDSIARLIRLMSTSAQFVSRTFHKPCSLKDPSSCTSLQPTTYMTEFQK